MWLIRHPPLPLRSTWAARHATGAAERLEITPSPIGLAFGSMPCGPLGTDFPAPRLLALVDVLFQPSLDGLPTVPHVTAHSVADWAVALVPPAVQGVNGDAQHFRNVRERHQLVTGLECHDHLPLRRARSGSVLGPPRQPGDLSELAEPFGQAARSDPRPVADWRPSKT